MPAADMLSVLLKVHTHTPEWINDQEKHDIAKVFNESFAEAIEPQVANSPWSREDASYLGLGSAIKARVQQY